ncbi:MAG: exonuclease SbcCD subunit D C-terminal domain-containing protein, partial [Lachnospiraceae bacterium]|nr:exonuclease SbcCD subunit D C-terminal domain-containing protein [Lachnospiraceae bacterium]
GSQKIRYCGTLLKYSFPEAEHKKSVTVVDLGPKGELTVSVREIKPMRDMVKIKGFFKEITEAAFYKNMDTESYIRITLLDEQDIPNAFGKLATVYPNLMQMNYENRRTMENRELMSDAENTKMSPDLLFSQFYETMNNQPMTKEQAGYILDKIEKIWGIDDETC